MYGATKVSAPTGCRVENFSAGAAATVGCRAKTEADGGEDGREEVSTLLDCRARFSAGEVATEASSGAEAGSFALALVNFAGAFFSLLWTKTVKTPGASSTTAVPQRLGELSPSRRMRSTLKLARVGSAWRAASC